MGIAESSPLSNTKSVLNCSNDITCKQLSISSDEYSNDIMPVITDVTSIDVLESKKRNPVRTSVVTYGPIRIKKRHTTAPTLATGRRSKYVLVNGEDAVKGELRRRKNREAARNLKKYRDNIEHELSAAINELESKERDLLSQIDNLRLYKQQLEEQCQQTTSVCDFISRTAAVTLLEIKRNRQQTPENALNHIEIKDEPRSSSPEWQLLFSI
jgi:hypothetical protein